VLVTHAETTDEAPRRLSETGIGSAERAAARITEIMGGGWRVKKAVSSPAVRCVETALVIGSALSDEKLRRIDTDPRLMAARDPMDGPQLFGALADYACDGLLVTLHADLANALPIKGGVGKAEGGWFQVRPVIAVLGREAGSSWEETAVEVLVGPDGKSLLPPGYEPPKTKTLLLT
jgi:hypothetical protein